MSIVNTSVFTNRNETQVPTILIIENEVSNRILIERVLSTRGYRCISASNGLEALNILEKEQVSLIRPSGRWNGASQEWLSRGYGDGLGDLL